MNIVILGAGNIGAYLASVLAKEQHNVILIDKDASKLERISEEADVATLCGYGSRWKLLDQLIENEPALFIAMTGDDETNLVACSIAKNLGYPRTVSRVKEIGFLARSRLDFGRLFFVDHFIGAEVLAANDILKNIINPEDLAIENFAHGSIQMRTIVIPDSWNNTKIPLCKLDLPQEIIIGLIRRKIPDPSNPNNKKDVVIFPHGDDHIESGDEITIIGETTFMHDLHTFFKLPQTKVHSVVIVGGTPVGMRLAHILELRNINVKLIEMDLKKCEELSELLPRSSILNQDGMNLQFLASEQVQLSDAFVACTNEDESNFLIAATAKHLGCKKIISLISDTSLAPILRDQNIHFSVSERVNIANRVLSIIHAEKILSIASLCDNQAKVIEIKVSEDCELVGIPLSELSAKLPQNLLITAIENRGRVMIGKGDRIISPNDTVILITSPELLHELQELF